MAKKKHTAPPTEDTCSARSRVDWCRTSADGRGSGTGCRKALTDNWPTSQQPMRRRILRCESRALRVDLVNLIIQRPEQVQERLDFVLQCRRELQFEDALDEAFGVTPAPVSSQEGSDSANTITFRVRTRFSRTAMSVRICRRESLVRCAARYDPTRQASARAWASQRSVFIRRLRWLSIGT